MLKNFLSLIFKSVWHRPMRGWLTILGIIIGVMLVVIIFALSSGIQNAVARLLQQFGSDLVIILPGKETNPFLGLAGGQKFKEDQLEKITVLRQKFPDAKIIVDGGVNLENALAIKNAGADILVSASYIWNSENPKEAYRKLCEL